MRTIGYHCYTKCNKLSILKEPKIRILLEEVTTFSVGHLCRGIHHKQRSKVRHNCLKSCTKTTSGMLIKNIHIPDMFQKRIIVHVFCYIDHVI